MLHDQVQPRLFPQHVAQPTQGAAHRQHETSEKQAVPRERCSAPELSTAQCWSMRVRTTCSADGRHLLSDSASMRSPTEASTTNAKPFTLNAPMTTFAMPWAQGE